MTDVKQAYPWTTWQPGTARKILIVRLGSLGDIIHTIPAQQALQKQLESAQIDWLVEPAYADLLRHIPGIQKVWEADTKVWRRSLSSLGEIGRLISQLRRERYDAVFDFQGLLKSAVLGRLTATSCLVGLPKNRLREKLAYLFYTCPVELTQERRHQIEAALDMTTPPRYEPPASAEIYLDLEETTLDYIETELSKLSIENPVLLNPGAGWPTKRWPPRHFAELANRIEAIGIPTVFTYGPGEETLIQEVKNAVSSLPVRAFPTSILELAALCRSSRLMIAGDTGPMHLAVAMKTPVVALIGPGYAWRTGPYGKGNRVIMHQRVCPRPYKRQCRDHFCMDIEVDRVFQVVEKCLCASEANCRKGE
jgi:lipopolysaccharide heptosyltransferase I